MFIDYYHEVRQSTLKDYKVNVTLKKGLNSAWKFKLTSMHPNMEFCL